MFSASAWQRFHGVWVPELPSTCSGKTPRRPSCNCSAVPGLAPVGLISSQSFPIYCFLESLRLQQLFTSLGLPFLGEVCPSHQLPSPIPWAIQVPAPHPYLFPIAPETSSQARPLSLHSQSGAGSAFVAHSPPLGHQHLPACAEDPSHRSTWSCPALHTWPEHFVSAENPTVRKDSYARDVEK